MSKTNAKAKDQNPAVGSILSAIKKKEQESEKKVKEAKTTAETEILKAQEEKNNIISDAEHLDEAVANQLLNQAKRQILEIQDNAKQRLQQEIDKWQEMPAHKKEKSIALVLERLLGQ
ncbi:MAG: hypothetical protein A2445_01770 [Candidatus Jacksonbacteria bacterium RIFOXYC2_FULL_44_29]|nr:MAG: hypothetical protein UW45_C0006G0022 [Parcubacteria group bacterium GW2011_GWC2_44_22]OGY75585.1 MAG: hypothetical protein A2295_05195 [Candidatus Jacksonbacteria bacterium RIFOXYB2_FULL_44_15]OGY75679.1 MAG: hypothetical protein A2240_03970 [Candidatus Jacksonbacteria bacterium RIFOXYA2_FULL_43_12]OGY77573.1 MAG: hypothetical protein A2445_01770 [Candidatus Jacksonbacteria bacterium RIFOXYC2_FULL_44_29]OGY81755.1 MAG: hypothetical protein A2550_01130 [Candidatus Jacksonbacteria bacteri